MIRRLILVLPLVAVTLTAFQWTNEKKTKGRDPNLRNVAGVVSLPDDSGVDGAVVQIKNLKTLQVKSFITQHGGKYEFQNLSVNTDYELKAIYKEYVSSTRSLSIFDKRLDAIINLKLEKKHEGKTSEDKKTEESRP